MGKEGSTNYPRGDGPHRAFKELMVSRGFTFATVEAVDYAYWSAKQLETLPPALAELVALDEWNKAVGRIPPAVADLFVRFRVNVQVNYSVVARGFEQFRQVFGEDPALLEAESWCAIIAPALRCQVRERYVQLSREHDDRGVRYGNAKLTDTIRGQDSTWASMVSDSCAADILDNFSAEVLAESNDGSESEPPASPPSRSQLDACHVDSVMAWAVAITTERIARMYAFVVLKAGGELREDALKDYLEGSPPLHFAAFPPLPAGAGPVAASIQRMVISNPQYDPSGMIVALAALAADHDEGQTIVSKLVAGRGLLSALARAQAVQAAYDGESPAHLLARFLADERTEPNEQQ